MLGEGKDRLLTTDELAEMLRMSQSWVQAQCHKRAFPIPWIPVGRKFLFRASAVEEWMKKVEIPAQTIAGMECLVANRVRRGVLGAKEGKASV